jgi:hypothetical protein
MAETTPIIDERTRALIKEGMFKPFDAFVMIAFASGLMTTLAWVIFGTPTVVGLLACALGLNTLVLLWISFLVLRCIRFVIDTGTARISHYSPRRKVQRLPIEAVSRASADQRAGRCGRVGPGICVRLYAEDDYLTRERFATPEIRRTNLQGLVAHVLVIVGGNHQYRNFLATRNLA